MNTQLNEKIEKNENKARCRQYHAFTSQCCNFSVYASTPDDFHKIHIKDSQTDEDLVMTIQFICNKCGKPCKIKRNSQQELNHANKKIDN